MQEQYLPSGLAEAFSSPFDIYCLTFSYASNLLPGVLILNSFKSDFSMESRVLPVISSAVKSKGSILKTKRHSIKFPWHWKLWTEMDAKVNFNKSATKINRILRRWDYLPWLHLPPDIYNHKNNHLSTSGLQWKLKPKQRSSLCFKF